MAIPSSLQLQIVSADRSLISDHVDEVELPGADGYFGVLPGHTPLLALLGTGELWFRKGQGKTTLFVAFGFAEVLPDRVTVLAQIAEKAEEIDVPRAQSAMKRAQDRLARPSIDIDAERAHIALMKAIIRIQIASGVKVHS